ncbi:conserved hypothetical protein, secreted [Candidatus Magnetomorum sp. HK-1]|nr:conserved hypothetical protein, secreted [Candidatus Magnetomorum sp. HK-1]
MYKYIFHPILFFVYCFFLITTISHAKTCQSSARPDWIVTPLNDSTQYYGMSSARFSGSEPHYDIKEKAKDRAIKDLSYSLSVSIQSIFEEHLSAYSDDSVKSSLMLSARLVLDGIKTKHSWADCKNHDYWVLVVIDKEQADKQVKRQQFIKQVLDRLKSDQDEIKKGVQMIAEISRQRMKRIDNYFKQLNQLSKSIDQKIEAAGEQSSKDYKKLIQQIDLLTQRLNQFQNQKDLKIQNFINKQQSFFTEMSKINGKIQSDYLLNYLNNDISNTSSDLNIQITPLKGQGSDYYEGERIMFKVTGNQVCFIKVLYVQSNGDETLLLPNVHDQNNYLKTGQPLIVGKLGELVVMPPFGQDTVTVVASKTQFLNIENQLKKAAKSQMAYVTRSLKSPAHALQTRAIGVGSPLKTNSFATDSCFIVSHNK